MSRPSASVIRIATPELVFNIVNSDRFLNIEHATIVSANAQLSGLLGQTVHIDCEVPSKSAEWRQQLENDLRLQSDELFGSDLQDSSTEIPTGERTRAYG